MSLFFLASAPAQSNAQSVANPVCTIKETTEAPIKMLVTTDTLLDESEAGNLLIDRFSMLDSFLLKQGLWRGKRILFTQCELCALFVEAAIEVSTVPGLLPADVTFREIPGGKFIVAHFEGAYDQIGIAFNAITSYVAANKYKVADRPFEVFSAQPFKKENPRIIMVDVYQRLE